MKPTPVRRTFLLSLPLGIVLGAAGAFAGQSWLDEADEHVDKAVSALKKADDPHAQGEYGGHRKRALDLLDDVKREIKKAKEFGSHHPDPKPPGPPGPPTPKPPGPPLPKPEPTSSGPKKPEPPPVPPKKPEPTPPKKPPEPPQMPPKK